MKNLLFALTIISNFAACEAVFSDVIYLKSGGFVEGIMDTEGEEGAVKAQVRLGTLEFDKTEVLDCVIKEYDRSRLGRYAERAGDGILIPNCAPDVKIVVDEINCMKDRSEREAYSRIYLRLAEKFVKRAKEHDIPLMRSKYFLLARGCFEAARGCDYCPAAAAKGVPAARGGVEAEGYRSPEDMKVLAEKGIALCNGSLAGQLRIPGIELDGNAEKIVEELSRRPDDAKKEASSKYLEAAKYYEKLSKDSAGPDRAEYSAAAMLCYLIVSEINPDPKVSNEAWAGYKRCGAYAAAYRCRKAI